MSRELDAESIGTMFTIGSVLVVLVLGAWVLTRMVGCTEQSMRQEHEERMRKIELQCKEQP